MKAAMILQGDPDEKYEGGAAQDSAGYHEQTSPNCQDDSSKSRKRPFNNSGISDILQENQSPKIIKTDEEDDSCLGEFNYSADENSINVLNDDCLFSIFSYLPVPDLIRIERVCKRWKRISLESWMNVKIISVNKDFMTRSLDLNHLEQILRRSGNYITNFDCSWLDKSTHLPAQDAVKLINKYCKKLEYLNISYTFRTKKSYLNCLDTNILRNLKSLTIGHYDYHDEHLPTALKAAVNLHEFSVTGYNYLKNELIHLPQKCTTLAVTYPEKFSVGMLREVLEKYPNIQNLDVSGTCITPNDLLPFTNQFRCLALWQMTNFFEVDSSSFIPLKCPNLRVLDIRFNDFCLSGDVLSILIENCPNVEDLRLERSRSLKDEHFDQLKKLRNLMYLDVSFTFISNQTLIGLSETSGKLKKLECYGCNNINPTGLSKVIAASPELTYLSISKSTLTQPLIKSALASLQDRNNKVPLTICLSAKNINTLVGKIPDLINRLELKSGNYQHSKTNVMRIVYGSSICDCNFEKTCFCLNGLETMAYFG